MARELMKLLTQVITAKRELKQVYYTRRNKESKLDAKDLVVATIGLQKLLQDLIELSRKRRVAKKLLEDRKAELIINRWSTGLPKRVKDYVEKTKMLEQQHLTKYHEALLHYLDGIAQELTKWIEDINMITEIPRPPRE